MRCVAALSYRLSTTNCNAFIVLQKTRKDMASIGYLRLPNRGFELMPGVGYEISPTPYYENPILNKTLRVGVIDSNSINFTVVEGALLESS